MQDRKCAECRYGKFASEGLFSGSRRWEGYCTALPGRPHQIEQNWKCSCNRFVKR